MLNIERVYSSGAVLQFVGMNNRTDLRMATSKLAERAKKNQGIPSRADIAEAHTLFDSRKEFLSDQLGSNVELKFCPEPDWSTWQAIAEFFEKYHAALAEIDSKSAAGMASIRRGD